MRRRDDDTGGTSTSTSTSTPRERHGGGAGVPCCGYRDNTTTAAAAAAADDGAKPLPAVWRRRCLAAAAFGLCTLALLFQDNLGRAAQRRSHAPANSSFVPAAAAAAATTASASAAVAVEAGVKRDLEHLPYRLDDGGPGDPWVPPDERPIPLDAFPVFNGHGFKADGNLMLVDSEVAKADTTATAAVRNSGGGGGAVDARNEEGRVETSSTLLFMHIWKCAGSSLRHLLRDWASLKGQDIGIVVRCADVVSEEEETICMQRHALVNETVQAPYVRLKQVVAGHFTWGFQRHVQQPYVMFTTLRNPLELFVSGQQYLNRKASKHFAHAVSLVEETMTTAIRDHLQRGSVVLKEGIGNAKSVGFLHRLIDPVQSTSISPEEGDAGPKTLDTAAREAKEHLDTFWLVGVVEQYKGFIAVLKHMMDPLKSERKLWQRYAVSKPKYNTSPQGAGKVLAALDPALVQQFNHTLSYQWEVYSYAVELYKHRCKQMLHTRDLKLCQVPLAASQYLLTDVAREELQLQRAGLRQAQDAGGVLTDLEREELQLEREQALQQQQEEEDGDVDGRASLVHRER